ncbi:ABC transporter permease subunit [Treponema sp.]|uniref:ABC transporter permease subunit n=1 Tax=Treponema sp. TaxID=166 RepID=UPI003F0CC440
MKNKSFAVIMKRELASYFSSPVAYIVGALFLLFSGFMFFSTFFLVNRPELRNFFELLPILFSFFIPAMTMRIFSEERKIGTMETLVTLPVSTFDIVAGKYLACFVLGVALLVPTFFYVIACVVFASSGIDFGPVVGGYLGAVLLVASFCAIGVFASSVTKNQIIAFFLAFAVCIFLTMITIFSVLLPGFFVGFASFISSTSHFMSVSRGIIDSRDILYFLSVTAIFISLSVCVISNQRKG